MIRIVSERDVNGNARDAGIGPTMLAQYADQEGGVEVSPEEFRKILVFAGITLNDEDYEAAKHEGLL